MEKRKLWTYDIALDRIGDATQGDLTAAVFQDHYAPLGMRDAVMVGEALVVAETDFGWRLKFQGNGLRDSLGDWYEQPIVGSTARPSLRCKVPSGALFALSSHQVPVGEPYRPAFLVWRRETDSWQRLEFEGWPEDRILGDRAVVLRDVQAVRGARKLSGSSGSRNPTGTWHFYDFKTGHLSSIYLDTESEILDMNGKDEVLARRDDELYIARMVDGRMLQPETESGWKEYWRLVVKDPRVREMKWVFLLDQ